MKARWLCFLALAACESTDRSSLFPAGPAARRLSDLGWPLLVGFLAVCIAMFVLIAWVAIRRTGSLAEHAPTSLKGGLKWVLIGGFIIPGAAFAAAFVATIRTLSTFPMEHHDHDHPPEIRVLGHQWWWEVQYPGKELQDQVTTANELHIPAGQPVDIELVSADVIHSFWVPKLHGKVDLIPGMKNSIRIQADKPGVYEGGCAEFCGLQHAHMRFRVVADEPAKYQQWLEAQRKPAAEPQTGEEKRGKQIFLQGACVVCHRVRGTDAKATVGPDLTHLAGRSIIAATFPRDTAYLHAWITNAPSLKPGTQMPALTQFNGEQLHDLVAYLQSLK